MSSVSISRQRSLEGERPGGKSWDALFSFSRPSAIRALDDLFEGDEMGFVAAGVNGCFVVSENLNGVTGFAASDGGAFENRLYGIADELLVVSGLPRHWPASSLVLLTLGTEKNGFELNDC